MRRSRTRIGSILKPAAPVAIFACILNSTLSRPGAQNAPGAAKGESVFAEACSGCHNGDDPRAPSREAMRGRSPRAIVDALTSGSMRYQGLALSGDERRAVAEFITGRGIRGTVSGATAAACGRGRAPLANPFAGPLWNGWGPTIHNTHFQPAAQAGVTADQVPRLRLKWAFGFPDTTSAWAQPTIAGGRLFVGGQNGTVYSLDAATGCVAWTFAARAGVRAAISIGRRSRSGRPATYAAYVADQQGFVYALDAVSGRMLWTRKVDDHPLVRLTGSPTLHDGRLYLPTSSYEEGGRPPGYACCTFRGSVVALDAQTGEVAWKTYTVQSEPHLLRMYADGTELRGPAGGRACSGAQFSAVSVIPGIVFSPSNDGAVRAYSAKDGAIVWRFDSNRDFTTLNGVSAKGGSMNGPAPTVAGGRLYIGSGYGAFGMRPGNVLLAFGVE